MTPPSTKPAWATREEAARHLNVFDFAVLDVTLDGEPAFPVAEVLRERRIPFVFSAGYGESGLSPEFRAHPVLSKPFSIRDLQRAIAAALSWPDT